MRSIFSTVDVIVGKAMCLHTPLLRKCVFFRDGWGDLDAVDNLQAKMLNISKKIHTLPPLFLQFNDGWALPETQNALQKQGKDDATWWKSDFIVRTARCQSPGVAFLPRKSQELEVQCVLPTNSQPLRGVVVILPGTGDMSYFIRKCMMSIPLARHGIASVLPMCAFYGPRKPVDQTLHYLRHITDMAKLAAACLLEATALVRWCRAQPLFQDVNVGVRYGQAHMTSRCFLEPTWKMCCSFVSRLVFDIDV
jgi:hypothetical protein